MLNVSWLEPEERNGRLLSFQLNVSQVTSDPGRRRRRQAAVLRSFDIAVRQRIGREIDGEERGELAALICSFFIHRFA